jgi:hypothetical protein
MLAHLPQAAARRPLVVLLQGCAQDAAVFAADTGRIDLADRLRFPLILPRPDGGRHERGRRSRCSTALGSKFFSPWKHYVPVEADLRNLHERLDWCLTHEQEAEQIGCHGQELASSHTFRKSCNAAVDEIPKSRHLQ